MASLPSTSTTRERVATAVDTSSAAIARRFEIDPRALAAFRIGLGTLLLVDLALRSRSLVAFYTDYGVLPREVLFADYSDVYSLHALSGEPWAIALLFAIAAAFAVAMTVGYRTRIATLGSWLLLYSLHVRNPMVLNGGDSLFRMLVLWAIFLPLGARWSVDAVRSTSERADTGDAVASVATMALLLQIVLMYATNAVHKAEGDLWMEGEAVLYIMQVDQFTVYLGNHIGEFHGLLRVVTVAWLGLLVAAPLLLVCTGWRRSLLATAYVGMHLGMAATMRIDIFPIVVIVGFIPFYGPTVWDRVERLATERGLTRRGSRLAAGLDRHRPAGPTIAIDDVASRRAVRRTIRESAGRGRTLFATVLPWFLLVLVVLSNAQAVDYAEVPDPAEEVLDTARLEQSWSMFAPNPIRTTSWHAAPGELADGTEIDVMYERSVTFDRPPDIDATYPSARWRKYLSNVRSGDNTNHRSYFANYLCDSWNRSHETDVERVTVERLSERTDPDGTVVATGEYTLIEYDCAGPFVQ
ncbi:HTTM domain-containing protein [Halovivax limisalsi]|uniref:HTTM domain-containing protein n=1 Tax=Halovivax limisalsi TaxID=1453760 RepID=UPI001FFC7806|nr:HTTM domain-containing protein [Halovivax limisalsi]